MKELSQEQKNKLLAAAEIVDKGDMAVLEKLLEFEDTLDGNTEEIKTVIVEAEKVITLLIEKVDAKLAEIKSGDPGAPGATPSKEELIALIKPLIPPSVPGAPGAPGKTFFRGAKGDKGEPGVGTPGKDGSPDTPEQIANKLESLEGDKRLDVSAIKGLDKMQAERDQSILNRAIEILDRRSNFGIAKADQLRKDVDVRIVGVNTQRLTVSAVAPVNPQLNDLWLDIS
jgi:hypothetical protein